MKKQKKLIVTAILAGVMAVPAVAMAQARGGDSGWYVGASVGQSKLKDGCSGLGGSGISCDDTDMAWKILGGYQVNRNFAAELGYSDLGKAKASLGTLNDELKATVWELSGIGSFPVADRFSIFGRLGVYHAEAKESTNFVGNFKHTNTGLTFGFGARYDFMPNLGVRAEWQRYNDIGGGDLDKSDVDVLSLGVVFKFR